MKPILAAIALSTLAGAALQAQQQQLQLKPGDVKIASLVHDAQKTPNFQAGDVKSKNIPNPRDWLEIEVEFEVNGPRDAIAKSLQFRYYVGFKDTAGNPRVLTGDVAHINVICGEKYFSCAYVAPGVLGEITGDFRRFQPSAVQAVGVEVIYNGVIVGRSSSAGNNPFWESLATTPGVLSKSKTPFALLWIDRYAEEESAKP